MLEKIKKALFSSYGSEEEKGVFFSGFDDQEDLIVSQGVLTSDMPLHDLVDVIYEEIEPEMKDIIHVVVDVVSEVIQLEAIDDILSKDPQEFGFALIGENDTSGVMLPGVAGVADAKHALYHIKKKYTLEGNVEAFVFRTERLVVSK